MEQPKRKFEAIYDVEDYEILTDTGWKNIKKVCETIPYNVYKLSLEDGKYLECADDHIVFSEDEEIFVKDVEIGQNIDTINGPIPTSSIENINKIENMYDIQVDGKKYYSNDILSHNTTCVGIYALWYAVFNNNKSIGIVSNKESSAKMILGRIKHMWESLPIWLKPGVKEYAKTGVVFDNDTKIIISATSPDAFRGESMNLLICLGGENEVKVKDKITGEIKFISIENLYKELENENMLG